MLDFFSDVLDYPYPYEKYAQVAVRHFTFGGMENLSATTQTDNTLHDERAAIDFTSDELVAHELAHQWFGDLITCESWAHAWLNEGFATYFDALFKEHDRGRDEFDYQMILNAEEYLAESYRRAIVSHRYAHPFQLFDGHLYPKAAWVLHMLRRKVGDELFWKAIRLYVKRHAGGSVETLDLIRCFEQASGKSLQGFFQQWLYYPGHPDLSGDLSWDAEARCVTINLKQGQNRDNGTPIYRLPIQIDARLEDGSTVTRTFEMDQATQTFYLHLASKPEWVALDGEGAILRTTSIKRPLEWLKASLTGKSRDARVIARVDAVRQAGEQSGQKAIDLLTEVLASDPFWAVQAEAATALGRLRAPAALEALLKNLKTKHPKARRAVVAALGNYRDPSALEALRGFLKKPDPSYFVQQAALTALGRAAESGAVAELRAEWKAALKRKDWHDLIAQGAAYGLVAAREESAIDDLITLTRDHARYWGGRLNLLNSLAELGAARPKVASRVLEELSRYLDDPDLLVAQRMPGTFVRLGHPGGIAMLRRKAGTAVDPHVREACLMAAENLAAQATKTEATDALRGELDKLRAETRELRQRLDKLNGSRKK
ncbi:MAG: M1 family aminopeptidase [Candidatus Eisenbacteria bacterium]